MHSLKIIVQNCLRTSKRVIDEKCFKKKIMARNFIRTSKQVIDAKAHFLKTIVKNCIRTSKQVNNTKMLCEKLVADIETGNCKIIFAQLNK